MNKGMILGSIAALTLSGTAFAEGFSYSYVDAGYVKVDLDDFDIDGDGFALDGSVAISDNFHAFASYAKLGFDFGIDGEDMEVGVGYNRSLNSNIDLVGTVSYLRAEVEDFDDSGFGLGIGLRGHVTETLELQGTVGYANLDDGGDGTTLGVGARYFFTPAFALGANFAYDDDGTVWGLGVRYSFAK